MAKKTHKTTDAARISILDAAEKVIVEVGPAGLRLSEVAKLAGMAHPNILHHFGSREGLIEAVAGRVHDGVRERLTVSITNALKADEDEIVNAMSKVIDSAYEGDQGKIAVWLAMSGQSTSLDKIMTPIIKLSHELRQRLNPDAEIDVTKRIVMLSTLALVGNVISGERLQNALFPESDESFNLSHFVAGLLVNLSEEDFKF